MSEQRIEWVDNRSVVEWDDDLTVFPTDFAPEWMDSAACKGLGALMFVNDHGDHTENIRKAKAVCSTCPVFDDCADYTAVLPGWVVGVWAGTTQQQRWKLRAKGGKKV